MSPPPTTIPARDDLYEIAMRQRAVMYCILGQIICWILLAVAPGPFKIIFALAWIVVVLAGMSFVFMLAVKIYSKGAGIALGLLTVLPFVGLFVLLVVNMKATELLRAHGLTVGLLGADLKQIP
ncbi:MAG TPA: hypothetical protein VFE58_19465 [Tepidisphaeraceae bacterium]|jgi:hypothetical protein|nr:hypothetical protein [Tepidisphaeraceae bacterium]